jgi:hypothetical protein
MAGWQTTANAAIAALVDAFVAWPALSATDVVDGPPVGDASALKVLTVGHSMAGSDDTSVVTETTPEGYAVAPAREHYDIYCSAAASAGDSDASVARTDAYDLYAAACDAVAADHTLGGLVMRAQVGNAVLHQTTTSRGRLAIVQFTVAVDAFTT